MGLVVVVVVVVDWWDEGRTVPSLRSKVTGTEAAGAGIMVEKIDCQVQWKYSGCRKEKIKRQTERTSRLHQQHGDFPPQNPQVEPYVKWWEWIFSQNGFFSSDVWAKKKKKNLLKRWYVMWATAGITVMAGNEWLHLSRNSKNRKKWTK